MRIGKYRTPCTIQTRTDTQDGTGAPIPAWSTFAANWWADIFEGTMIGKEAIQAGQVNPTLPVTIKGRYISGVTALMRVTYGSRTFEIMNVINVHERNLELELTCVERL